VELSEELLELFALSGDFSVFTGSGEFSFGISPGSSFFPAGAGLDRAEPELMSCKFDLRL